MRPFPNRAPSPEPRFGTRADSGRSHVLLQFRLRPHWMSTRRCLSMASEAWDWFQCPPWGRPSTSLSSFRIETTIPPHQRFLRLLPGKIRRHSSRRIMHDALHERFPPGSARAPSFGKHMAGMVISWSWPASWPMRSTVPEPAVRRGRRGPHPGEGDPVPDTRRPGAGARTFPPSWSRFCS